MNIIDFFPLDLIVFAHDSYEDLEGSPHLQMIKIWKAELIKGNRIKNQIIVARQQEREPEIGLTGDEVQGSIFF